VMVCNHCRMQCICPHYTTHKTQLQWCEQQA
jgi:hypothetical protein